MAFCGKNQFLGSKSVLSALILVNITVICIDYQYLNNSKIKKNNKIHKSQKQRNTYKKFAKQ